MQYDWPSLLTSALILLSAGVLLAATMHDIAARTIPNWTACALAPLGIALRAVAGDLPTGLLAGLVVFVTAAVCWWRGWLGGGDVKLLGALAIVVPPGEVLPFIAAVSLAGGVLAAAYVIARRLSVVPASPAPAAGRRGWASRVLRVERWRIRRGRPLPYACAIAAGFLFIIV